MSTVAPWDVELSVPVIFGKVPDPSIHAKLPHDSADAATRDDKPLIERCFFNHSRKIPAGEFAHGLAGRSSH